MIVILSENWNNEFDFYGWQNEIEINGNMNDYYQMVSWINEHISNPTQNVSWTYDHKPVFRFRKAKDQIFFTLRWA